MLMLPPSKISADAHAV